MSGGVGLTDGALDALMPLHLVVGPDGSLRGAGPTFRRMYAAEMAGAETVFDLFDFRRPRGPASVGDLIAQGGRLSMVCRSGARTSFKGLAVPLPDGGALVNLSFGIGAVEAVATHRLSARDFAHTDLTTELLYLVEAQNASMAELKRLNLRLEGARSAAERQAMTDPLTGLANRRALESAMDRLIAAGLGFGLLHLDLDLFKQVNDSLGHAAGDAVLVAVADILAGETRPEDLPARIGGDEFVIILNGMTDPVHLTTVAGRIIARIERPIPFQSHLCCISASIGGTHTAFYAQPGREEMLHDTDVALYAAKRAGRGRAAVHGAASAAVDAA